MQNKRKRLVKGGRHHGYQFKKDSTKVMIDGALERFFRDSPKMLPESLISNAVNGM